MYELLLNDLLGLLLWWLLERETVAGGAGRMMVGIQLGSPPGKQGNGALSVDGSGALWCLMLHCP